MKTYLKVKNRKAVRALTVLSVGLAATMATTSVSAQHTRVTTSQQETAQNVAKAGVPLADLMPNAPDRYTVQSGDTLWGISKLFLKSPWRWPELWGMNLQQIKNPHRIYPKQVLILDRSNGVATLRVAGQSEDGSSSANPTTPDTVVLSPRTRAEALPELALPTLRSQVIEAFLAEPMILDATGLEEAPRIVATQEERVLLGRGDRAYARGTASALRDDPDQPQQLYRIFRNATALKDPDSGEVLAYEAQYIGKALLVRSESSTEVIQDGVKTMLAVPATIDIVVAKEEMRKGDRMLPEPRREFASYAPRAPDKPVQGRIVSIYGSTAVKNATQNQVVSINLGLRDGMAAGLVLAIQKDGVRMVDSTDPNRAAMKLPDERNGILMVFKAYERVSYALILEATDAVRPGDRLTNPR